MTNSHTTPDAAQVAAQYRGHIKALTRYLARVGVRPEIINQAVAEAIAQIATRPDIDRPMAYLSTVARGEAERLSAELDAEGPRAINAPDLMAVLEGKAPTKPRQRRQRAKRQGAKAPTESGQLFKN